MNNDWVIHFVKITQLVHLVTVISCHTNTMALVDFYYLLALEPSKTVLVYHTAVQPGLGKLGIEWRDGQMDGQMNDY